MNEIIMYIMAAGAIIGGIDRIAGCRLGLGSKFEEGFMLLGPTALSMAGIICLTPVLSGLLQKAVVPLWLWLGLDPALLGGILAIDMGGYQLAMELAVTPEIGKYAGLIVAATFGCTITFTIPVGMGMLKEKDQVFFTRGMLVGIGTLPICLTAGGLLFGLNLFTLWFQSLPIWILSAVLVFGIRKYPKQTVGCFSAAASLIKIIATIGLILGAVSYMTGLNIIPAMTPVKDAMEIVSSIGIVMLGSLPTAEILQRLLRHPLNWIGTKTGMSHLSVAGLLIGMVSPVPVLSMMKDMDDCGKIVNSAALVASASAMAAHMGFVFGVAPEYILPLLGTKIIGGIIGALASLFYIQKEKQVFNHSSYSPRH